MHHHPFQFFFLLFKTFHPLFSLTPGLFQTYHYGRSGGGSHIGIRQRDCLAKAFFVIPYFDSTLNIFWLLLVFFWTWPRPFFAFTRYLRSSFRLWFHVVGTGVLTPKCGCKLKRCTRVSYVLFLFTGITLHRFLFVGFFKSGFYPPTWLHGCFNHLSIEFDILAFLR